MYIHRNFEKVLAKALKQTKIVLITGARQVGKSTTVQVQYPNYTYITLDDENELALALNDRTLFFRDKKFPLIIDEVQYAKELLRAVKLETDRRQSKGQIILTGSQTYELLSASAESLAGRVTLLEMPSLSARELYGVDFQNSFLPDANYIEKRGKKIIPYDGLWEKIHRGFMPDLLDSERDWEWFYRDYVRTYIERDIRNIINIQNEMKFRALLVSIAARSGQLLIYDDIARDIGVDIKTVQRWISVIAASGLIKILHTYKTNAISRIIKTPKLYFMDTGLLCYLVGWKTPESARNGAMSENIFETFVISEIIKSRLNNGQDIQDSLFYYRDKEKREIDLLIKEGNTLYPIEIKKGATPDKSWIKNFSVLEKISDISIGPGAIVCQINHAMPVSEQVTALPVEYL